MSEHLQPRPNTQEDRDRAMVVYWEQQLQDSLRAVEVAQRQLDYLAQLLERYDNEQ